MKEFEFLFASKARARSALVLPNCDVVLAFDVYDEAFLRQGDPYSPVLRFLHEKDGDRNIFCFDRSGAFVWQVARRPAVPWSQPFSADISLASDGTVSAMAKSGHIYLIDPRTGFLSLTDWTK